MIEYIAIVWSEVVGQQCGSVGSVEVVVENGLKFCMAKSSHFKQHF